MIHARPFSQGTKGNSAISGETRVEEKTRGDVRVSELSDGDVIFGIMGSQRKPGWCKVIAVFPAPVDTNKNTHDGLETDHMVTIHTNKEGDKRMGVLYTLGTDCAVSVNSTWQAFSPISTAFCPRELTWRDYATLMSALRRVSNHTGYLLFDTSGYHENGTAKMPHWFYKLHELCRQLLLRARDGQCKSFKVLMETYAHERQSKGYVEIAERVFPNMSSDVEKQEGRTITEMAVQHGGNRSLPFIAVGCAMGALLVIAVVIVMCGARIMEEEGKKNKEQFTNDRLE